MRARIYLTPPGARWWSRASCVVVVPRVACWLLHPPPELRGGRGLHLLHFSKRLLQLQDAFVEGLEVGLSAPQRRRRVGRPLLRGMLLLVMMVAVGVVVLLHVLVLQLLLR